MKNYNVGKQMESKIDSLSWNVLTWGFNEDRLVNFNIFDNANLINFIKETVTKEYDFDEFLYTLDRTLCSCFGYKCEYEILIGGLFTNDKSRYKKVDVYSQLKPNLKQLAAYIYDTLGLNRDEN